MTPYRYLQGRTVFLTGATGFIGSHLLDRLLEIGVREVRCLARRPLPWHPSSDARIVRIAGDLTQVSSWASALLGVDVVIHVAGRTAAKTPAELYETNVDGTVALLEAVRTQTPTVHRVIVASSLAAIGKTASGVADESSSLNPVSAYGASKAEMERALVAFSDLPITVVRPPAVYGPREENIFLIIRAAHRGLFAATAPIDQPIMSLIHVDDLVEGMIQTLHPRAAKSLETYFFDGPKHYTWSEIHASIRTALERRSMLISLPRWTVMPVAMVSEFLGRMVGKYPPLNRDKANEILYTATRCRDDLARTSLNYQSKVTLDRGMKQTVAWYKAQQWL